MSPLRKNSVSLGAVSAVSTEAERFWKRPALPLLLALVLGIFWARFWPLPPFWPFLAAASGLGAVFFTLRFSFCVPSFFSALLPLLVFFFLGHLTGLSVHRAATEAARLSAFPGEDKVWVTGRIEGLPRPRQGRVQSHLSGVILEEASGRTFSLTGRLLFTLVGDGPMPEPGSRVRFHGAVRAFDNFENPGGFDYHRFQQDRGIHGRIWCHGRELQVLERGGGGFVAAVDRFRLGLGEKIRQAVSDEDSAAVMAAMLIGDRTRLRPALREAYAAGGLGHLLAISGLHVGLLAGGLFWLCERLFRFVPALTRRGATRRAAALPALLAAFAYALISGGAPSALRAVLMVAGGIWVLILHRSTDVWSLLALAVGLLLCHSPERLVDTGFLLSVAAVAGLILGFSRYPMMKPEKAGLWLSLRFWVLGLFKTSLFAALFTAPVCLHVFREVSLLGPGVNPVLVPLMGMLALPLGMAGLILSPMGEGAVFLLKVSGLLTGLGNAMAFSIEKIPFALLRPGGITLLEAGLLYGFLLLFFCFPKGLWTRGRMAFACVLVLLTAGDGLRWIFSRQGPEHPVVTVLDVGQGSASGIRLPGGRVMLVDGGGFSWADALDTGRAILSPWLDFQKIRTLDVLVLSHPHADHIQGFFYLAERYPVLELWISETAMADPLGRDLVVFLRDRGTRIRHPDLEEEPPMLGGVTFRFFGPGEAVFSSVNDASLVFRMESSGGTLLFTGDAERQAELFYVRNYGKNLASDVLLAGHHGSRTSTTETFLGAVTPSLAILSCGLRNPYRYPSVAVLRRLESRGARVLRTDTGGAVQLVFGEEGIEARHTPIGRWDRLW